MLWNGAISVAAIKLENLAHSYYAKPVNENDYALKSIDYSWEDGGAYALLGPSGCGKTTLLNIISGLLVPSRGQVLFDNQNVTLLSPEQRNIAQVFQFPVVYDTMTVAENLAFPLANRGVNRQEINSRVTQMLNTLELTDKATRRANLLTADDKQKISLGRGLVRHDVNAILFDEPLTVIDPQMKWELRTKLKEIHQRLAHTMIYVTHDQTEALTFADKVVVMHEGEVVQIGTPQELFDKPDHTFVGYFIGSPGMNILPCSVNGDHANLGDFTISLNAHYAPDDSAKIDLGIRPEYIRFHDPLVTNYTNNTLLPVTVEKIDDIGRHRVAKVQLANHDINVLIPEGEPNPDNNARIVFDPAYINIYANDRRLKPVKTTPVNISRQPKEIRMGDNLDNPI